MSGLFAGTLYNQQYFTCDWWFNVDCSTVEDFYSLNDDIAAAQIEAGKQPVVIILCSVTNLM